MLTFLGSRHRLCDNVSRRDFLKVGALSVGGLTLEELARAKEKLLGAQEIRNQSDGALAFSCALDELYGLGHSHYRTLRARVESVTLEQVREVAARYFTQPCVAVTVRPE